MANVVRILAVMDAVSRGARSPSDIRRVTGIPHSTLHRIMRELTEQDILRRDEDGGISIGARIRAWADDTGAKPEASTDYAVLERLLGQCGESVQHFRRMGESYACVASVEPADGLRDTVPVGSAFPLRDGPAGRILLAYSAEPTGLSERERRKLSVIRDQGYAMGSREAEKDVLGIAVPVHEGHTRVDSALCVSGPAWRMGPRAEEIRSHLAAAAQDLRRTLRDAA
ncbi:IclR family transcriptional regulator [Streptomyces triculaminicus]|uniref:IclR family transcriptional regulator n=1 Tax=Streptomyces triculaminicus TaxID=2816232 RepID=UPI0037CFD8A4